MTELPELPATTNRILELRSKGLLDAYRLTGNAVVQYSLASDMTRRIAFGPLLESTSRYFKNWFQNYLRARRECGISSSVEFAKARFNDLASEYMRLWSPSAGCERFADQLQVLKVRVLAEVASIWRKSDATATWYEAVCAPSVEAAVSAKMREFESRARNSELAVLARARLGPERTGNPILDEINAAGDDPDAIKRLSPQAQEAIRRAKVMMGLPLVTEAPKSGNVAQRPELDVKAERARPGPKRYPEIAKRIREIVLRIAGSEPWKPKLDDICDALDEEGIPPRKVWSKLNPPILNWVTAATSERERTLKALEYQLEIAES